MSIQQGFITGDGTLVEIATGNQTQFKVGTAGRLELPGELPSIFFKGKGDGTVTCAEGTCDLVMELDTRTKGGSKLSFYIARLDIDHTSAGIILQDFGGIATCQLKDFDNTGTLAH